MPVASSSRSHQRNRRAPSSDIEEDGPSQAAMNKRREEDDVEMDEEEEQPRRSKKNKKKRAQQDDSDAEGAEEAQEEVPEAHIDDQPISKNEAKKLHGIIGDWAAMRDGVHMPGYGFVRDLAASVAEFTEGEKGEKAVLTIESLMRELLDTEYELTAHEKALDDIYQKLMANENIAEVHAVYEKNFKERMDQYKSKTSRQKYAKSEPYAKFKQAIHEVRNPESAMPPLVDLIPKEDGDDSDDDDDIQMGGITQDYKCPLSLRYLTDPLTSKLCGHSYDADCIREYLRGRGTKKTCPSTGCRKEISMADLQPDKDLAKRASHAERREREREEDNSGDDEEVIE